MSEKHEPEDIKVAELCDIVLQSGCAGGKSPSGEADGNRVDAAIRTARALAQEIGSFRAEAAGAERRRSDLLEMVTALATFDYTRRAVVTELGDSYDGCAYGLNMLAEELAARTVSKQYVDNILKSMRDLLAVVDPNGIIRSVNDAATAMSGYPAEALLTQPLEILFPDIDVPALVACNGVSAEERVCSRGDEPAVPVSFSASVMRNHMGDLEGLVCVARDLTAVKRIEEERWNLREDLRRQAILLEELSTPLIPITEEILVLPLVGPIDEQRAQLILETLLHGVATGNARVAIIDITGVRGVDERAMQGILKAVKGLRLIGARVMISGVRPEVARAMVATEFGLSGLMTFGSLRTAIVHAMRALAQTSAARARKSST
jgi:rsbT co-antagonist protein RsbR